MNFIQIQTFVFIQDMRDPFFLINILNNTVHVIFNICRVDDNLINFRHLKQKRLETKSVLGVNFNLGFFERHEKRKIVVLELYLA